jgi:hypothetical protein
MERLGKPPKFSQDDWPLRRDLYGGFLEYKAEVLAT